MSLAETILQQTCELSHPLPMLIAGSRWHTHPRRCDSRAWDGTAGCSAESCGFGASACRGSLVTTNHGCLRTRRRPRPVAPEPGQANYHRCEKGYYEVWGRFYTMATITGPLGYEVKRCMYVCRQNMRGS